MREADPLACRSKKTHQLNRSRRDDHLEYVDGFSQDHRNKARDFLGKEAEDFLRHQPGSLQDMDSSSSDGNAKDKRHSNLEHEHSMAVGEFENGYDVPKDVCVDEWIPNGDGHDKASNTKSVNITEYVSDEESNRQVLAQEKLKSPWESPFAEDAVKHHGLDDSMQESETNSLVRGKRVTDASEDDVDRGLLQDFGARSPSRPFLNSLKGEGNKVKQPPDQISSRKAVSEGPDASTNEGMQARYLNCNNIRTGSNIFNFNSSTPVVGNVTNGRMDIAKDQSVDPVDVLDQKDADAKQVYCHSSNGLSIGKAHEPSLDDAESVSSDERTDESVHSELPDHKKEEESARLISDDHHQFAYSGSINNSDGRYNVGESSDAHSGGIAFPGNVSLRSDSSTTSGRSFTFPILQPEWNTSPMRMTRADEKRLQKKRSRKPAIFCCGF